MLTQFKKKLTELKFTCHSSTVGYTVIPNALNFTSCMMCYLTYKYYQRYTLDIAFMPAILSRVVVNILVLM